MKITILAVGSSKWERFIRRWGVSFLIGEDVLFDTFGDADVLLRNMRIFSIDRAKIKHIILSHDDWDHIAGLWYLIQDRPDITVYICPGFRQEIKDRIALFGVRIVEADSFTQIKANIFTSGQMQCSCAGRSIFEQVVVIKSLKSLMIITGCAHPGILNIVRLVKANFPKEKISCVLGGFHLKDNTDKVNMRIIERLKEFGIGKIIPMHCTGKRATQMIRGAFGHGFVQVKEGDSIEQ